jgi:uncharacterized protein (DUF1697 family)
MTTVAVFLRGVNVGGKNIVSMPELKALLLGQKFQDVQTFLNSGNITLQSGLQLAEIKNKITGILRRKYPFPIDFLVKTIRELQTVLLQDPFREEQGLDKSKRCVAFLSEAPSQEARAIVAGDNKIAERYVVVNDLIYIYYHDGIGRSYFSNNYIERHFNIVSTVRNVNTLEKIVSAA